MNALVILVTAFLFATEYFNVTELFRGMKWLQIGILVAAVILVHIVKAVRLYLAIYGSDMDFRTYLKTYCKVTPVSVVFPYKLGEFFRMYCYGKHLGSGLKGVVIVLLDRFMDTVALITLILFLRIFVGGSFTSFTYVLLLFLALVLMAYYVFPGVYAFWKKYLLRAKATENKLAALKLLDACKLVYGEIANVTKGRGVILYGLSLIAWSVEIGSIAFIKNMVGDAKVSETITAYLSSAMSTEQTPELRQFVLISVILMIALYLIIKMVEFLGRKKVRP